MDVTNWASARQVFRAIDRAARQLGFDGDGDALVAPPITTVGGLHHASLIFLEAKLGRLPSTLYKEAVQRCRRIIATSTKAPASPTKRLLDEGAAVKRVASVAARLGLRGGVYPEHAYGELSDDGAFVAGQLVDRFGQDATAGGHQHALRAACGIVGNSTEREVAYALWRLKNANDPPRDSVGAIRSSEQRPPEAARRSATTSESPSKRSQRSRRTTAEIALGLPPRTTTGATT